MNKLFLTCNILGLMTVAVFVMADPPTGKPCNMPHYITCTGSPCDKAWGSEWPCCNTTAVGKCCQRNCREAWCEGSGCADTDHHIEYGTGIEPLGTVCFGSIGQCQIPA